jgi:hypothetical protein
MWKQDRTARTTDTSFTPESASPAGSRATGDSDDITSIGQAVRPWALQALIAAYGRDTHRLLTDLADQPTSTGPPSRPIWNGRCPTTNGPQSPPISPPWPSTSTSEMPAPFAPTGSTTDFTEPASPAAPSAPPVGRGKGGRRGRDEGQPHLPVLRLHRRLRQRPPRRRPPSPALLRHVPARPRPSRSPSRATPGASAARVHPSAGPPPARHPHRLRQGPLPSHRLHGGFNRSSQHRCLVIGK